jgi:D-beta-D-heptose 7-phosphate kinase/D-beta-D-heptose 1-phosphate adenosyltransferase
MEIGKLIKIIDNFSGKKIGVVGDLMLDEFISGNVERISPEAPIPVVLVNKENFMPGGAANVANNISSLGGDVFVMGSVGKDRASVILLQALKSIGVNVEGIIVTPGKPTIQKTRIVAMGQQIVRLDREKIEYIDRKTEEKVIKFVASNIKNWDAVVISDYSKGFITPNLAKSIIGLAIKFGKPVIADTKNFSHAQFFKDVTLIKPNLHEAKNITGLQDLRAIGQTIQKNLNCNVLVTQGADGMTLFEKNKINHFASNAREVFDVSGAGDTVIATFILSLVSGADFQEAAAISNHAAGIAVGKSGTAIVIPKELKNDLEEGVRGFSSKIKSQGEIIKIIETQRRNGKKIVAMSGSFDILHIGHIKSLEEAKKQGDVLLVLLNSDESVRTYKGPGHPINSQQERAQVLAALEFVNYITIFDEINPIKILERIKPDIYCNGSDWGKNCVEREVIEKNGGRIHILKWTSGISTTNLTEKILKTYSVPDVRAVFFDRDGTINVDEPEYVHEIKHFKFTPQAIAALKKISKTDYKIIIITNQSGIGRGYFKESDLKKLHEWMMSRFKKEGIRIDKIYYCPHGPEEKCSCRKPAAGMVLQAARDFGINISKSWIIGNGQGDIVMGRETNLKTIRIGEKMLKNTNIEPNYYAPDVLWAVDIILSIEKSKLLS